MSDVPAPQTADDMARVLRDIVMEHMVPAARSVAIDFTTPPVAQMTVRINDDVSFEIVVRPR